MKKIKILFTIPNFTTAGSGREMVNIIERLDKAVFEPVICVQQEGGVLYEELLAKGCIVIVQQFMVQDRTGMLAITAEARHLAKSFRKHHFDIWQSFNWSSDFSEALVAKFAGAKYVYVKKNMNWNRAAWKVKSFLSHRIIARNVNMLFYFFAPPYLRRKTKLIYGGVDVQRFFPLNGDNAKSRHNLPADKFIITCVAQLVRVKDQLTLVRAVAELPDIYLVLAGAARDDEYVAELYSLIQEAKLAHRVLMAGPVREINSLLSATDVFVLPTSNFGGHEEGCPVAVLEAMAAEVPCIVSKVAGNVDLVRHNETGLLFKPGDVAELKACIQRYMDDAELAKAVSCKAKSEVLKEFTLEHESAGFSSLYKQMMRIKY